MFPSLEEFPQLVVIHTSFSVVNETEVDVFLKFSCFFYDPTNVDNLISGSSAFFTSSLNICKFMEDTCHYTFVQTHRIYNKSEP